MFSVKVVKLDDDDAVSINCAGDSKHTNNSNNADDDAATMLEDDDGGGDETPRNNGGGLNLRQRYKKMMARRHGRQQSAVAVAAAAVGDVTFGGRGMHDHTAANIATTAVTEHNPSAQQPLRDQK